MKTYEIYEDGIKFAAIEAGTATSALRKAAREYPRRAVDYNHDPSDPAFFVTWRAAEVGATGCRASAEIIVPGKGTRGCKF